MTSPAPMILTWRDIRDRLGSAPCPAWQAIEVDIFGLRAYADDDAAVFDELEHRLGPALDRDRAVVDMVGTRAGPRSLPVKILPVSEAPLSRVVPTRPLWSTPSLDVGPIVDSDSPAVAAFFSFKGGVGRTTSCFATLVRLLNRQVPPRVLYVDADVEAPGITWMVDPEERLSWVDALALVHDADDWRDDALGLIAERVALSRVGLELDAGRREFFLMPAVRRLDQIERIPATPEQVVRGRGRDWVIGDLLIELARRLAVDVVLVDLRAGLTEFASPLLLDPRVHDVLVTSCARQSVLGIVRALEQVELRTPWPIKLDLLVTQVPPSGDELFKSASQTLLDAWANARDTDEQERVPVPERVEHEQQLIVFDDLQAVASRLPGTSLWKVAEILADRVAPVSGRVVIETIEPAADMKNKIARLAERFEFAEQNGELGLLPTPPLQALARASGGALPSAVVLGSKGAGKTFTWAQLVLARTWAAFAKAVEVPVAAVDDVLVFPLLSPVNLGEPLHAAVRQAEAALAAPPRLTSAELGKRLQDLRDCPDGVAFWLTAIVERLGLEDAAARSVRALDEALAVRGQRVVLAVDGIEDALQTGPSRPMNEPQRVALRGILIELVNQLREISARNLGLVTMVRQDLARESIPQNFGHFEARHRDLALTWSKEDALRLVLWLLNQAGWTLKKPDEVVWAPYEQLAEALHPFWNEKMGGPKDAFTDRWVIAALSDLKGRFQARDIVRLVRRSTEESMSLPVTPTAIRDGVEWCSEKKIEEIEAEVSQLRSMFDKLRQLPDEVRSIPLPRQDLGLTEEEIEFLEDQGLLLYDKKEEQFYMPEILRHGLRFTLSRKGRARVLGLQRSASGSRR